MAENTEFEALMKKILESSPEVVGAPPVMEEETTFGIPEEAFPLTRSGRSISEGLTSLLGGARGKAGDILQRIGETLDPGIPEEAFPATTRRELERKEIPSEIARPVEKPIPSPVFWRQSSVIQSIIENDPIIGKIIQAESSGDSMAESPKGAIGLMQIMPATARGGVDKAGNKTYAHGMHGITLTTDELYDPEKNVKFGSQYFNALRKSFGNDYHALVAYHDGPGKARKWEKGGAKWEDLGWRAKTFITNILGEQKKTGGMIYRNPYPHNPRSI